MEEYIRISTLNDFLFCPKSIYYHGLYDRYEKPLYQDTPQIEGTYNHERIDSKKYSTSKDVLQGLSVYSEYYGLAGKIDLYHRTKQSLMERKTHIKELHKGYIYQLIAQYLCLMEMGYPVKVMKLYSMVDNKAYTIPIPNVDILSEFSSFLEKYKAFQPDQEWFVQDRERCMGCIYRELCDFYLSGE